jgi:amino acid adenylation domain-containing protein
VVFGTVLLGRLQGSAGAQRILGMFINTLPLRLRLQEMMAGALVEQTQRELVELLEYEQASLAIAQRCSGVNGGGPLFNVLFNYRRGVSNPDADWANAGGIRVLAAQERTNYPLVVSVDDLGEGFTLGAQTDRRIAADRVVGYLACAVRSLVEALEESSDAPVLSLPILPAAEREELLERFNVRKVVFPAKKLIQELFEEQVLRTPQVIAVQYEQEKLTYEELNARANQLARYLRDEGVKPDDRVAICMERGVQMLVGILGTVKAGGAYVPLDPTYPAERLAYMLADAAPKVLLTERSLRGKIPESSSRVIALDDDWKRIGVESEKDLELRGLGLCSHHLAYVIYTSGSTGQPKGVMVEHRHVLNLWQGLEEIYAELPQCRRIALNASINFDASVQQWLQLCSGRTVVVVPQAVRRDASELVRFLEVNRIEGIDCTPSQLKTWVSAGLLEGKAPQLQVVLVGGESIDRPLWEALARSRGVAFYNVYGPTECTVDATVASLQNLSGGESAHIGRPMSNRRVYILDRQGEPVPIGVTGEICIGGEGVARGYLSLAELTAERFVRDRFSGEPEARMYRTGDVGRWRADGTIEYLGRNDHQVKIRGFRIELGEIEAQLLHHPRVKEAVVLAREDVVGEKRLVAYLTERAVETPGESRDEGMDAAGCKDPGAGRANTKVGSANADWLSVEQLRGYLKEVLPEHMIPSAFVVLERLPQTPSGKVDRRALPTPEVGAYTSRVYEAPKGEREQVLAGIWQELLRLDRIGRYDNFFELGGHSLLGMKLVMRIAERLQVSLAVTAVFQYPTLRQLSEVIESLLMRATSTDDADEQDFQEGVL